MYVEIRRCPITGLLQAQAAGLAWALRQEPGVDVRITDGSFEGEFTVFIDGEVVAQRCGMVPGITEVVNLVRGGSLVDAGA
jgi:hypothetical protein